jgi:hypothetical protein
MLWAARLKKPGPTVLFFEDLHGRAWCLAQEPLSNGISQAHTATDQATDFGIGAVLCRQCRLALPLRPPWSAQQLYAGDPELSANKFRQKILQLRGTTRHQQAIAGIKCEVQQESQRQQARTWVQAQQQVEQQSRPGMQGMEADAATQRVIDWVSQQMIDIDQQACQQPEPAPPPLPAPAAGCHERRHEKMQGNMADECCSVARASG